MQMTSKDAFARFGSYLAVDTDNEVIYERLGDFEAVRKNASIGDDPHPWYFENTYAGLIAAMEWAYERRSQDRAGPGGPGAVEHREQYINRFAIKIHSLWAKTIGHKAYLEAVEQYKARTAELAAAEDADDVQNVKIVRFKDELELGIVPEIGSPVFVVGNNQGGVTVDEYKVTGYSAYERWENNSTVDAIIHSNYGEKGDRHMSHVSNDGNGDSYSNRKVILDKAEALEQARVWAQELIDVNSKWL